MDLRRSDLEGLNRLGALWKTTPGAEFEAMLTGVDLTSWQDVIQYLRSLGMRENQQIVKMNICLANNIRLTLEGAGAIQAYCRDNRIADKPFVAMLKENIDGAEPVQLGSYSVKAKLKREIPLAADDARVKEVIARWDSLGKHFRNIQRFEFAAPGGVAVRFDVSIVRENVGGRPARTFQESRITTAPAKYEIEVELTAPRETTDADTAVKHIIRGISWLLQGRQRSYVLVSNQGADAVRDGLMDIFGGGGGRRSSNRRGERNRAGPVSSSFRFPGPQPATLERRNMLTEPEPGVPSLLAIRGGYNVTDKADGLRCLLYVADNGRIFLVDAGGRVYATGRQTDTANRGTVLDGEWIRRDKKGASISHYLAFDILAEKGGNVGVASMPFLIAGALMTAPESRDTRQKRLADAISALSGAAQTVRGIPSTQNLQIGMKTFRTADGVGLFREAASVTLESAKTAPYSTDGLIFTPNAAPIPLGRGTWADQLKWKPPHENTIDFLVVVDRERGRDGAPGALEAIGTKYREDSGQTVRYKTLRLFVGSNQDVAYADPRRTVLGDEALPADGGRGGEYREVEFRPTEPRDPMASICYVAIGEGVADPAGAAPAALTLDTDRDIIRTTRTGDIIQSDMIVEMAYHPERAPGWRWEPIRVRHDKTERWLAQQAGVGRKGGTMNADWVANSIWSSIHNPVTEDTIRTGNVVQCAAPSAQLAAVGYSMRRAPARDLMKAQCLTNFHTDYIKRKVLLRPQILTSGATVCDIGMGRGEDMSRWITAPASYVLGCDVNAAHLNDPTDGAYRRLLDKMVALGGRDRVPPMVFVQADAARRLSSGEAGLSPEDQTLLRREFSVGGGAAGGFDVVSCMFAVQNMFRDENALAGLLVNLADTVKVGGYFVGCGLDGDAVANEMAKAALVGENMVVGRDGAADVWMMTRRYGSGVGATLPVSSASVGLAVDVDLFAMGESRTEFLVSWLYLQKRLREVGLDLLTPEETAALGLPASTQLFSETWAAADVARETYDMSPALRRYSFMHRWWVLRRREDRRPAAPLAAPAPVAEAALTQMRPADVTEAPAPAPAPAEEAPADVIDLGVEEAPAAPPRPFIINWQMKIDPESRIGPDLVDWPVHLTQYGLAEIRDPDDPSVVYPSIEAALASLKFRLATDYTGDGPSPASTLGKQLFGVGGTIHQKYDRQRQGLTPTSEAYVKAVVSETKDIRIKSAPAFMSSQKLTFAPDRWAAVKDEWFQRLFQQRYETDARFRAMVDAIRALGAEIIYANIVPGSDLGKDVDAAGVIGAGGENKIGRWLLALAA